jgi:hypothetical protein
MPIAELKPYCLNCKNDGYIRKRNLCQKCYYEPKIRAAFPVRNTAIITCKLCGELKPNRNQGRCNRCYCRAKYRASKKVPLQQYKRFADYSSEDRQKIIELYDSGESARSIAKSLKSNDAAIRTILRDMGYPIRITTSLLPSLTQTIIRQYQSGKTVPAVAEELNQSKTTVWKILTREGVYRGRENPRPRKDAARKQFNQRVACALRNRLVKAVKRKARRGSAVRDLGCTIPEFIEHIAKQFKPGMSWDNWGKHTWHIDHIQPLASFDLRKRRQVLKAVHFTNLRPLWARENLIRRHEERRRAKAS